MTAPTPSPEQVEAARAFFYGCEGGENDHHTSFCGEFAPEVGCEKLARLLAQREARVREEERERCAKVAEDYSTCHLCAVCAPHPVCEISQYDIASAIREGA